jgi:CRP-like cAMP-binding protein
VSGVDRSVVAGLEPFADWAAADLDALLAPAHARRFDKGASVFEQGAPADSFFLLLDGHVQASKLTPDGRQIIVRYIGPGELFGIAAQIREATYPATAKAVVESLALVWPSSIWPELASRFPALSSGLLQSVGARLADANARMMEMATEPVERRLAHALLRLAERSGRSVKGGVEIDFPVTRQDLGEMVGTTLFTVSRLLSAWESEGLVESGRARIVVRRPDRLSAIAEGGDDA